MDLTQIKYFYEVVLSGSVSEGARRCGVSQPAVSARLKQLEDEVSCKLFYKKNGRLRLTDAGRTLYRRSNDLLNDFLRLEQEVRAAGDGEKMAGRLNIGCGPLLSRCLMPEIMGTFTRQHPNVDLALFEEDSAKLPEMLENGEIDLGVGIQTGEKEGGISFKKWFNDEFVLISDHGCSTSRGKPCAIEDIAGRPFVATAPGSVINMLLRKHFKFDFANTILRARNLETVVEFVKSGLGVSLVPAFLIKILSAEGLTVEKIERRVSVKVGLFSAADQYVSVAQRQMANEIERKLKERLEG